MIEGGCEVNVSSRYSMLIFANSVSGGFQVVIVLTIWQAAAMAAYNQQRPQDIIGSALTESLTALSKTAWKPFASLRAIL